MKAIIRNTCIVIVLLVLIVVGFYTVTEYRPKEVEPVIISGEGTRRLAEGDSIALLTWNTGFAALDGTRDFFMDGGTHGSADNRDAVQANVDGMIQTIASQNCDIVFLQEVDTEAKRSFRINMVDDFASSFGGTSSFAVNYKAAFVPVPLQSPLGGVESGIQTLTSFPSEDASRIRLPNSYSWPVSTCQLKRCLLRQEIPLEGSDKKLILVNLHLDAYADGDQKAAQTSLLHNLVIEEYEKGNYVIAGGDFNQTIPGADSSLYPVLNDEYFQAPEIDASGLPEGFRYVCDDSVPTSRLLNEPYSHDWSTTQLYVIDGFLLSPNVRLDRIETLNEEFRYTDHNPVRLEVTLLVQE